MPAALVLCLLLFLLAGGIFFTSSLQDRIFEERTTQLVEITSQVQVNLDLALDAHWNYLTAAVNILRHQQFDTAEDVISYIGTLDRLLETDAYHSKLMLLDDQGNCYDADGTHGVWSDIGLISGGGKRNTFISDSYDQQSSYWTFVQTLDAPLELSLIHI